MEYPRGKTHSCSQCGAAFSKLSLLEEHKRILGHRDIHTCDVCHKTFYRIDNLQAHKRKHSVQVGGAIKRKAATTDGPPLKRRITKYDDPKDSYTISIVNSQNMPKFNTTSTRYKVSFKDLDIRGVSNIVKSLRILFKGIIQDLTEFMEQSDLIRMSVQSAELDYPISLPFMRVNQLTEERFLAEIERVIQSYEEFVIDESLDIEIIHVSPPKGGTGKRPHYIDLDKMLKDKKCFIRIQNNDDLCCARAIVTAKARIDNNPNWNSIRLGRKIQESLARQLHEQSNVPLGKCSIEDIKSFQRYLHGYQITVLSKEHFNTIIYEGPPSVSKIYLYLHDGHYDVITKMPAFLGRKFYCHICKKGYDHKEDHSCFNKCHICYKIHEDSDEDWQYCNKCNRHFRNTICYDKHKEETTTGKSTCKTNFRCRQCDQLVYLKFHKKEHVCGEHYCKICKDYVSDDHQCYMQPVVDDMKSKRYPNTKPSEKPKTFIFFDFECRQDDILQCLSGYEKSDRGLKCKHCKKSSCGARQHTPNLCVAQKVCETCLNREVDSTSWCESCGTNEYVFKGENTRDDFCRWLFSEENMGATVICHNFKGYDSYPILQYLYKNAILPDVIATGSKYMSIEIPQCNIRFIDSINFIPMALEKFTKTFDIRNAIKGYFAHLYNTKENQNAVLDHLPDIKFYQPDAMKDEKRADFLKWYERHKNDSFHFNDELLKYCKMDVELLRKGCLRFREMFLDITKTSDKPGIDPFESCTTIAAACNLVFRRNFLQDESIAIIPANGYNPEQKQSLKALKWLKYIAMNEGIIIQHARNGGEKRIGQYMVDGYRETKYGEKIVYEFHGCFWHGCDRCFERNTVNPVKGVTMSDLFQKTMDKKKYLEDAGFCYKFIWECDFDKQLKNNQEMKQYVDSLPIIDPLEPREAFYGGRTEAFSMYEEADENNTISYYDVTSLYPFINKTGKIPLGHPVIITDDFEDICQYEGLVKCKIVPPRGLFIPVLPIKCNGKLLFGLCRTCMDAQTTTQCEHNDDQRALVGTWVTDEVKMAISKGYEMKEIYEVWHFDNISQYDPISKEGGIFTDYINTFLKIKQESSGWPYWCKTEEDKQRYINEYYEKEGIRLHMGTIKKNPGLRQLAKLMLNSFWGKFGQRSNLAKTTYVKDADRYFDLLTSDEQEVQDVSFVSDDMVRVQWLNRDKFVEQSGRTNVVIAAYTTAQARLQLHSYLERLGKRTIYCDTDSVVFSTKPGEWHPATGDYLGDLTDEVTNNRIEAFVCGGPKNYAYKLKTPDENGKQTCCKIRGITLNYQNSLKLNFETVKEMVTGKIQRVTVSDEQKIRRDCSSTNIITCTENKDYKIVFDKRVLQNNFQTVPYGM